MRKRHGGRLLTHRRYLRSQGGRFTPARLPRFLLLLKRPQSNPIQRIDRGAQRRRSAPIRSGGTCRSSGRLLHGQSVAANRGLVLDSFSPMIPDNRGFSRTPYLANHRIGDDPLAFLKLSEIHGLDGSVFVDVERDVRATVQGIIDQA